VSEPVVLRPIDRLLRIMQRLRSPQDGCPWDLQQNFASIAPYTIEEAYEVADAIARQDLDALRDELGDLLFQVVFHAQMAQESGAFDFDAVATAICDKMERRHPHVFGTERIADARAQTQAWEEHKAKERAANDRGGALADVPLALPALMRAAKLGKRAARVGFDWPDAGGARQKIDEELAELDAEIANPAAVLTAVGRPSRQEEELGDLLFSVVNLSRHLGVDPEVALRGSNARFAARFAAMEGRAAQAGQRLGELDARQLDELWRQAKDDLT